MEAPPDDGLPGSRVGCDLASALTNVHFPPRRLGPDKIGCFRLVMARTIHSKCVPTEEVRLGQHCTVALKPTGSNRDALKRSAVRKGMVLVSERLVPTRNEQQLLQAAAGAAAAVGEGTTSEAAPMGLVVPPAAVRVFEAWVHVLHHSTTIAAGYTPMIHLGVVRQAAKILSIKGEDGKDTVLRTGSKAKVTFKFMYCAEYLTYGRTLIFREGRAKGVGRVCGVGSESGGKAAPANADEVPLI